jgi:hypothetical protein
MPKNNIIMVYDIFFEQQRQIMLMRVLTLISLSAN